MLNANSRLIGLKMDCDCPLSMVFEFPIMETYYFRNQKKGNKHNFKNLKEILKIVTSSWSSRLDQVPVFWAAVNIFFNYLNIDHVIKSRQ